MYNAEQKEQFIKAYSTKISVRRSAKLLFNLFEPFEESWGADLCTRDLPTLQAAFDQVVGIREVSRKSPRTILRKYVEWCRENNIPGTTSDSIDLDISGIGTLKVQMIRSPRHLQAMLDSICLPESEQTADNYFRVYYWLCYAGMREDDIVAVRTSDVDFSKMNVHFGEKDYPIYREAIPAFRNCVELAAFKYKHGNYVKDIWKPRADGDILVRGTKGAPSVAAMRVELSRRLKLAREAGKTQMETSYYKIWLSGVFYQAWEEELAGGPVDFRPFVDDKLGNFQYSINQSMTQEGRRRLAAADYHADYERWKQIFM